MPILRRVVLAIVCLGVTGRGVSWADSAQPEPPGPPESSAATDADRADWAEDPYAPHVTRGMTARLGTAVGFLYGERLDVLAIGATASVGHRWGRLAIEAELTALHLQTLDSQGVALGNAERLGAIGRFDVLRIGPRWVGANSLVAVYVEGGADVAWNHWYAPGPDEPVRAVPGNTKRVEGQVGFGVALDHRLQEPIGFPHRIGWFLGWRFALSPAAGSVDTACRGESCRTLSPAPAAPEDRVVERSLLFQSSLEVTW